MGLPDEELLDPSSASEHDKCLICHEVLLDPVECRSCHRAYCRDCIMLWLERSKTCPHCSVAMESLTNGVVKAHWRITVALDELQVRCPKKGCSWVGRLDRRPGHTCTAPQDDAQWEVGWSEKHNLYFFMDRQKGEARFERPHGCELVLPTEAPVMAPPDEHPLPEGWERSFDLDRRKWYYFNRETGERTWTMPGSDSRAETARGPMRGSGGRAPRQLSSRGNHRRIAEAKPPEHNSVENSHPSAMQQWELGWSAKHKRYFFMDRRSGVADFERPGGCNLQIPDGPPRDVPVGSSSRGLPRGWEKSYDLNHKMHYYYNHGTGERTWTRPAEQLQL
mmetsp:Transcript_54459/g.129790  ORF Transcript_54459/g.129790 Transcript_54459/m.129790 type:complete len:335 (+) Transcript_54459:97-1101(+)